MELWCCFDASLNKLLDKHPGGRWFETPLLSCHITMIKLVMLNWKWMNVCKFCENQFFRSFENIKSPNRVTDSCILKGKNYRISKLFLFLEQFPPLAVYRYIHVHVIPNIKKHIQSPKAHIWYVSAPGQTFSLNIGLNTSFLRTPLCHVYIPYYDFLQGSSRLCNWLSLLRLVPWIYHLPPVCWSTFWKSSLKL